MARRGFASVYTNQAIIEKDLKYTAHNYKPLPVVLCKGQGSYVWDVEGKKYLDFLCGYSSTNQGHCHPKIIKELVEQAHKITLTSRAFHNDQMGMTAEFLTTLLGYDKMLPMNTGVEACETAVKLARRWGYRSKGIPDNQAKVVMCNGNFWGRSITASGACDDPQRYAHFGPFTPGFPLVDYNDVDALRGVLEKDPHVCAVMFEPIQGEGGVIVPAHDYLRRVKELCKKHNVLLVLDEVQTGFGRTGKLMAHHWEEGVKPDIVAVGKALSGGTMPVSAAFADDHIMMHIKPGDHGSTYGGNPLGMAVARVAIQTLLEERMVENALAMGDLFQEQLSSIRSPLIKETRGRGLFRAVETVHDAHVKGDDLAYILMKLGLLTKASHDYSIRLAPALNIKEKEIMDASKIIKEGVKEFEKLNNERAKSGNKSSSNKQNSQSNLHI